MSNRNPRSTSPSIRTILVAVSTLLPYSFQSLAQSNDLSAPPPGSLYPEDNTGYPSTNSTYPNNATQNFPNPGATPAPTPGIPPDVNAPNSRREGPAADPIPPPRTFRDTPPQTPPASVPASPSQPVPAAPGLQPGASTSNPAGIFRPPNFRALQ